MTPGSLRIAVVPDGEREMRAFHALAALPEVARIGLVGKPVPVTWPHARMIHDLTGWDVVVGPTEEALRMAAEAEIPAVVPGEVDIASIPVVHGAGPPGLARALVEAFAIESPRLIVTETGSPEKRGPHAAFPAPVGVVRTSGPRPVEVAPVEGPWGGVLVTGRNQSVGVVDDARFLEAATLAAGVACLDAGAGVRPVWADSRRYLDWVGRIGVVVGGAATSMG